MLCSMTTTVLPEVGESVEDLEQAIDVGEVEAGRGLVQDVEGSSRRRGGRARPRV